MKVIKPQKLGVLMRTYELDRKNYLVVSILAMFPFDSPTRLFPDAELWKFAASALGSDPILDGAMPKPRAELLVTGKAWNVGGARPFCVVRARIGSIDKSLRVTGDRIWITEDKSGKPSSQPSEPVPFDMMPLEWERAYGGEGYATNPLGRGYWTKKSLDGNPIALPNVEDPRHPVTRPDAQPEPAGFGAYDLMWPQRFSKVGTHDERWLKEQFPGFALDMDPGIFNTAPADQQLSEFFRGDEPFEVENMHPERALLSGTLPSISARAFVTFRPPPATAQAEAVPARSELREVAMRLDTVRLFPNDARGIVVFRGVTEISEDDADDVAHLMIAAEKLGTPPLPMSHYTTVLDNRLDRKKGAAYALRDRDLVPDPDPDAPRVDGPFEDELAGAYKTELLHMKAMTRRMAKERARVDEAIREAGLDPSQWVAPELQDAEVIPDDPVERAEYQERMIATAEKMAAEGKAEAEARARVECAKQGVDYDAVVAKAQEDSGGPPKFSAQAELTRLRCLAELARIGGVENEETEAPLHDPGLEAKLVGLERQILGIYRGYAHHFPPAPLAAEQRSREVREEVRAGRDARASFAGRDLTGVDLSGLDLSGCDFTEALLERANLEGCRLDGALLQEAVLTRASLRGACLDGAELTRSNLGGADLTEATLRRATLSRAILSKARLDRTVLDEATLDDADLSEAMFTETSFAGARGARLTFTGSTLVRVRFDDAEMPKSRFLDCTLDRVSFLRARFPSMTLMTVKAGEANFDGANLDNLRCVSACELPKASLRRASLKGANLREAALEGADFEGADLQRADLSKAKLAGANLHRVLAREARFDRTDLTGANLTGVDCLLGSLRGSILRGADLRGSSFFAADFFRIVVDQGTRIEGAGLGRVRFVERRPPSAS